MRPYTNERAQEILESIHGPNSHVTRVTKDKLKNDGYARWVIKVEDHASPVDAEIITSELKLPVGGITAHSPVLDIDMGVSVVRSSTEGHHHLYIDKPMTWRQYKKLLRALARAGIVEKNYVKMSIRQGYSAVRVPWLRKPST